MSVDRSKPCVPPGKVWQDGRSVRCPECPLVFREDLDEHGNMISWKYATHYHQEHMGGK